NPFVLICYSPYRFPTWEDSTRVGPRKRASMRPHLPSHGLMIDSMYVGRQIGTPVAREMPRSSSGPWVLRRTREIVMI
ncbi:MAG: hypothetical protein QNI85_12090, partial [Desulfobacterales bacterium]|nr:hypothetical protein [Desulfobacterales bacterium]